MSTVEENPGGDSESNDVLLLEKGGRSTVQNFFGFKLDDDAQRIIICMQCFGIVTAPQGNTMSLYNKLRHHHKIQYELQ